MKNRELEKKISKNKRQIQTKLNNFSNEAIDDPYKDIKLTKSITTLNKNSPF